MSIQDSVEGSSDREELGLGNNCQELTDECERKRQAWPNKKGPIVITQGLGDGNQEQDYGFIVGMV